MTGLTRGIAMARPMWSFPGRWMLVLDVFHKAETAIAAGNLDGVWRIRGNAGETP